MPLQIGQAHIAQATQDGGTGAPLQRLPILLSGIVQATNGDPAARVFEIRAYG